MEQVDRKNVRDILEELYSQDPSLREHASDLERVALLLIDSKPNAHSNPAFISRLRSELHSYATTLMNKQSFTEKPAHASSSFLLPLSFGGVGIATVLIGLMFISTWNTGGSRSSFTGLNGNQYEQISLLSPVSINSVEKNAFGSLVASAGTGVSGQVPSRNSISATGMGGGGGYASAVPAPSVAAADMAVASENAAAPMISKIMPPIQPSTIEYVYKGEELKQEQASMDVLRLSASSIPSSNMSAITGTNYGIVDVSSFSNLKGMNITLVQDVPFGYMISIDYQNGWISINQNWQQWQSVYPQCQDDQCWKNAQLKPSDVPSDDELTRIANEFLDQHRIDRSSYGSPEVDRSWQNIPMPVDAPVRAGTGASSDRVIAQVYVPDSIQITYPLLIQGKPVYNSGGTKSGMTVGVNLRAKRVSNVDNIRAMKLDASAYDADTDVAHILDQAKKGGYSGYMYAMGEGQNAVISQDLGTPTVGYVQVYSYKDNQSSELYVPAMIFPVTSSSSQPNATYYYGWNRNVVIVPLVKGIVEENVPLIRPMMVPAATGGQAAEGGVTGTAAPTPIAVPVAPAPELKMK